MRILIPIVLTISMVIPGFSQSKNDRLLTMRLDSAFLRIFKESEPGGSIFIQQGKRILYERSFGLSDLKTKEKFTGETVANLGSISKTFVAYGILILQNQGKLSVGDSIIMYFPEFKNRTVAGKIRIKHLLAHTSGLPDCRNVSNDSIFYLTAKDYENFRPLTLTDTLEFEPGSQWNYSNPAYNGLALIIEKVCRMRWQDFIIQQIFNPSGMKSSKITDGSYPEEGVAHGYSLVNGRYQENDYGEFPTFPAAGNGGVWSSVSDLRKYADAIKMCKFTDCATLELSKKITTPDNWQSKDPLTHSLVWFVHPSVLPDTLNMEKCLVIEHAGDQGGFRAHFILIPENDLTIIWITNCSKNITEIIRRELFNLQFIE